VRATSITFQRERGRLSRGWGAMPITESHDYI
jgi:hypothetical protein